MPAKQNLCVDEPVLALDPKPQPLPGLKFGQEYERAYEDVWRSPPYCIRTLHKNPRCDAIELNPGALPSARESYKCFGQGYGSEDAQNIPASGLRLRRLLSLLRPPWLSLHNCLV